MERPLVKHQLFDLMWKCNEVVENLIDVTREQNDSLLQYGTYGHETPDCETCVKQRCCHKIVEEVRASSLVHGKDRRTNVIQQLW